MVTAEVKVDETDITSVKDGQPADITIDALPDKVFKGQASLGMVGEFLFWSTPQFLSYIIAIAVLLAAL